MNMPLALELTEPVLLAGDLNAMVRAQMCGATQSQAQCNSYNAHAGITVDGVDLVIDDNDIL
jgi:endonuclease/exonuclease/phosphatase (EEP) superfamily protein YafD